MSWGLDYNGGPHHKGICPECGHLSGTCYDELCEICEENKPVKCPSCGDMVDPHYMTTHGVCIVCYEDNEDEFAERFSTQAKKLNEIYPLIQEIIK